MVRRILAIPLAVVVAIAVFLYPVICATPSVNPSFMITVQTRYNSNLGSPEIFTGGLGSITSFAFKNDLLYSYRSTIYFDEYVNQGDLFIAVNTDAVSYLDLGSLSPYYVPSSNIVSDVSVKTVLRFLSSTSSSPTTPESFYIGSVPITFLCFKNVPSGTVIQIVNDNPAFPGGFVGAYTTVFGDNYPIISYGIFNSSISGFSSGIIDLYKNGSLTFNDALDQIYDFIDSSIDSSLLPEDKLLQIQIGQKEVEELILLSDDRSLDFVFSTLVPNLRLEISNYVSGVSDLSSTLEYMRYHYSSSLYNADTVEQGSLASIAYQLSLSELEVLAKEKSLNRLDSAVSDEQLTEADEYYQSEEELINMFEVAEFESALDFQLWFNTLPPSETLEYKKFFDYLLNDSSIRMFLVVPISLILVRILLGTHLLLSRGGDHSDNSIFYDDHGGIHRYSDDYFRGN